MSYVNAPATKMLATHCACCGRPLVDADSVDLGIGPDCRSRYMKPEPGTDDTAVAFAVLAAAGLPQSIMESVAAAPTAREQANVIVHFVAVNRDDDDLVLSCATALRSLGYATLADKVADGRTSIRIEVKADEILVYTPRSPAFLDALRGVPRRRVNREYAESSDRAGKVRRWRSGAPVFKCWAFPADAKRAVWNALVSVFPGQRGYGPRGAFVIGEGA